MNMLAAPPLLNLDLFTRANGRMAAMQALVFFVWAGFVGWMFYAAVSSGSTARLNLFSCSRPLFFSSSSSDATHFSVQLTNLFTSQLPDLHESLSGKS